MDREDFFEKINDVMDYLRSCNETLYNYAMSEFMGLGYCCEEDYQKFKQNQEVEE